MYEYHGWATIRETATYDEEENMEKIVINIKEYINHLKWSNGILDLNVVNGDYQLIVAGLTNHKGYEAKELFKLYNYIAKSTWFIWAFIYLGR